MTQYRFRDISEALPVLMGAVMNGGNEVGSRAGRVQEILYPHIVLEQPWRREILAPLRNASLPAQIAETMWMLAGRDDVAWLQNYLPRAANYSDDGVRWRGAYGKRLRAWPRRELGDVLDQLAWVVDLLKADPISRRAVMSIYDPDIDSADGKDIPCNNWVHFLSRLGELHMHVTIRSNDLMWGWSGINAFEWSAVQEIVAGLLGVSVGKLHFSISSLHLYDRHWGKAANIARQPQVRDPFPAESPRFEAKTIGRDLEVLDLLVKVWFRLEEEVRTNPTLLTLEDIKNFPEPMLRSWLQVIGWWWSGDDSFLQPLQGTPLYTAAINSPRPKPDDGRILVVRLAPTLQGQSGVFTALNGHSPNCATNSDPSLFIGSARCDCSQPDLFTEFVSSLHAEKHAVYGDSWKKRGEVLSILANIARKIDRLGEAGGGDTAADTAIDLLVYLVKYRLWLKDKVDEVLPTILALNNQVSAVSEELRSLPRVTATTTEVRFCITLLKQRFAELEALAQDTTWKWDMGSRIKVVDSMTPSATRLARRLWEDEQPNGATATQEKPDSEYPYVF